MNKYKLLFNMGLSASMIALADNFIKETIDNKFNFGERVELLDHGLIISKVHNKGLPLNKFDKYQKEVAAISAGILVIECLSAGAKVLNNEKKLTAIAHSLIIGGALSNTYDRVKRGYVVDYLSVPKGKAVYNISDFAIFSGAILSCIVELLND